MEKIEKITKKDVLMAIRKIAEDGNDDFGAVTADDVIAYVDTTISQLENKAVKAKQKAAEKKAEGDELRNAVEAVLSEDFQTIDSILNKIEMEDVTKSKITARLTQLVKANLAHKTQVKLDDGRKVMAYAKGPVPEVSKEESAEE